MVSYSDVLNNLKTLLDKFYVRKQKNDYNQNGVVVTNSNREIVTAQSISASSSMISGLSTVATSGQYSDLTGKPTKVSDFTNDSGYLTSHQTVDSSLSSSSTNPVQNKVINTALNGKLDTVTDKLTTNTHGTALSELKVGSTSKGTIYHPKVLSDTASSGLYKITVNTDGHITGTASVGSSDLPSHTHSSDNITGLTASQNVVTNSNGKLTTEAKYTHPTTLSSALSTESLYKITANTNGHITKGTSVGIDTTNGGTNGSSSLITSGAVYNGLNGKLDACVTYTTSYPTGSFIEYNRRIVKFTRWGDVVLVEYSVQSSTTIASGPHYEDEQTKQNYTICYIPNECIPPSDKYIDVKTISTAGTDVRLNVSADGRLRINQSETDAKKINMFGSFTYNRTTETY